MRGELEGGVLPKALRSLTLEGDSFVIRTGVLPLDLETLILTGNWTLHPSNVLSRCQSIVKLVLNHSGWRGYVGMALSMYPPNLVTLVLGPNSIKSGALPEGLTHLELVDVDFVFVNIHMFVFPQTLKYVKISRHFREPEEATFLSFADSLNQHRPDIVVEVGVTEYEDVFNADDY